LKYFNSKKGSFEDQLLDIDKLHGYLEKALEGNEIDLLQNLIPNSQLIQKALVPPKSVKFN